MHRPRLQFRLWMIFALTALVGWGMVAVPYWLYVYPKQKHLDDQIRSGVEAYPGWELEGVPPPPMLSGIKVLVIGIASSATLTIGLALYRFSWRQKSMES